MNGDGPRLTRRQEAAILALLSSPSIRKAAAKVQMNEKTLRSWLAQPEFMKAYRAARRQLSDRANAQLQRASGKAVRTLVQNLKAPRAGDQIRAAVAILTYATQGGELIDLAEQVEDLRRMVEGRTDRER